MKRNLFPSESYVLFNGQNITFPYKLDRRLKLFITAFMFKNSFSRFNLLFIHIVFLIIIKKNKYQEIKGNEIPRENYRPFMHKLSWFTVVCLVNKRIKP